MSVSDFFFVFWCLDVIMFIRVDDGDSNNARPGKSRSKARGQAIGAETPPGRRDSQSRCGGSRPEKHGADPRHYGRTELDSRSPEEPPPQGQPVIGRAQTVVTATACSDILFFP